MSVMPGPARAHRAAQRALVGVVLRAREAVAAEGVTARRRHWLEQQVGAQAALQVVAHLHRARPVRAHAKLSWV